MKKSFGFLPSGAESFLYTIAAGGITAQVTDYGANLVNLLVPDRSGQVADVVLGFDSAAGYAASGESIGATVGRNANRIQGAAFHIGDTEVRLTANENGNNLHSGPDVYNKRMWEVEEHTPSSITLRLDSPHGDQGFPGNAVIRVTYRLDDEKGLHILYEAVCDRDTVFNMTNHSYFNLAGHDRPARCMEQLLTIPGAYFMPDDAENIPTGEIRSVANTPMDFRTAKPIGRDIDTDYECLNLQGGFDHNWVVANDPCAVLEDPVSGRVMEVSTDLPGIQFYAGNFLKDEPGKNGTVYPKRSGICLETQYYPDAVHHPLWPQPITKAGDRYRTETVYRFK